VLAARIGPRKAALACTHFVARDAFGSRKLSPTARPQPRFVAKVGQTGDSATKRTGSLTPC